MSTSSDSVSGFPIHWLSPREHENEKLLLAPPGPTNLCQGGLTLVGLSKAVNVAECSDPRSSIAQILLAGSSSIPHQLKRKVEDSPLLQLGRSSLNMLTNRQVTAGSSFNAGGLLKPPVGVVFSLESLENLMPAISSEPDQELIANPAFAEFIKDAGEVSGFYLSKEEVIFSSPLLLIKTFLKGKKLA